MPTLHLLSSLEGDKRVQWEKDNEKDVAKARKLFKEKLKEGFSAFGYKTGEKIGKMLRKFDPGFDRILMVPPMAGG